MALYIVIVILLVILLYFATLRQQQTAALCRRTGLCKRLCAVPLMGRLFKEGREYETLNKTVFILFMLLFWFLTAFRSPLIGNDTKSYMYIFNRVAHDGINLQSSIETGFQALCYLVSKVTLRPQGIIIASATVCYAGTGAFVLRYCKNPTASLLFIYVLAFSSFTNILRQSIAMVVLLYVYQGIKQRRFIAAAVLVFVASLFHMSSLVFVPVFFYRLHPKKIWPVLLAAAAVVAITVSGAVTEIFKYLPENYRQYLRGGYAGSGWLAISYNMGYFAVLYALLSYIYQTRSGRDKKLLLTNYALLVIVCGAAYVVSLALRLTEYFMFISVTELPNAFDAADTRRKKLLLFLMCVMLAAYFVVILVFRPEWNRLYPYSFFWQ